MDVPGEGAGQGLARIEGCDGLIDISTDWGQYRDKTHLAKFASCIESLK